MSKLIAALLVTVAVLAGCSSVGEPGGVVPSEAFFEVTVRAVGPGRLTLEQFQVDCSDECALEVPAGAVLHPQPVADEGGRFRYWAGACSGAADCAVLVDSDTEIVAAFEESDDGGPTSPGGEDQGGVGDTDTGSSDGLDDTGTGDDPDDTGASGDVPGGSDDGGTDDKSDDDGTSDGPGSDGLYFLTFGVGGTGGGRIEVAQIDFVCTGECGHNSLPGETLELEAVADEDSFFVGWTGACEGSSESCTITMDEDDETFALFRLDDEPLLLVVDPIPDGGAVRGGDIDCGDDGDACSSDHASGETIELRAEPAAEFAFAGWSGDCAGSEGPTCEFTIDEDAQVSAIFEGQVPMHELTVEIEGIVPGEVLFPNGVSCRENETCDEHFPAGSEVTLKAVPDEGYIDGWEGTDCDPHATTCTILMDRDKMVAVSFHTSDLEFVLTIEEPSGGTIETDLLSCGDGGDNCQRDFAFDDEVRLRAVASEGFEFAGWGGDCASFEEAVCDLVFRDNKDVSAGFQPK